MKIGFLCLQYDRQGMRGNGFYTAWQISYTNPVRACFCETSVGFRVCREVR